VYLSGLDFYERLGVEKDANDKVIKKAYRKLSLKYHPDKVKGKAEEKDCSQNHFIAITKAYETLSDPDKRKKYDVFGDTEEQQVLALQRCTFCGAATQCKTHKAMQRHAKDAKPCTPPFNAVQRRARHHKMPPHF
jgi:DnaJ-class molecular chaperone